MSEFDTPDSSTEPQSTSDVDLSTFEPSEAPSFEAADAEAPETDTAPETPAPDADDPFADFGGREAVESAMRLYNAAATEDGIIQIFIEAGRTLGLTVEQMQRMFSDGPVPGAETPAPEFDPDEPLTKAEWLEFQRRQQLEQERIASEIQTQQALAAASQALHATVSELGLKSDDPAIQHILALGDRYLDKRDLPTPQAVREAVRRGYADYQALVQRGAQEYANKKRETRAKVPGAPSGASAPSAPAPKEPKDVAEAIRMFRERYGQ